MKIRGDFVTNSSSANYGALRITCKPLVEMMENYRELAQREGLGEFPPFWDARIDAKRGTIDYFWEESGPSWIPNSLDEVLDAFNNALEEEAWGRDNAAPVGPFMRAVYDHRDEIERAIEKVSWDNTDQGWGGDSESRYNEHNYSPEMLQSIKEAIAAEHGYTVDDITKYDFNVYVGQFTSMETDGLEYDRDKGVEKFTHDFGFL